MPTTSIGPGPAAVDYTSLSKSQLYFSFFLVTSLFFLWRLSYGLLDVLNKHFLTVFGLTKTKSTLLQFAYFVSYLAVAPPMGVFMRRYGYKKGIHIGLGLFSIGAVLFCPAAKFEQYSYGVFVAFTLVSASGIATLETAANSYITILGPPSHAVMRLTLAQAFNGIATVISPQIAANTFFNGDNQNNLGNTVQYLYLAFACFSAVLNVGTAFATLLEVKQAVSEDQEERVAKQSIWKQYHTLFGAAAQSFYVGAQVAVTSFTIFYITEQPGICHT
ncbi:hypothetical protein L198_03879 [Cryptococcus wingfieldii CBS 7118]|uniref:Major facilitator superfamily (MFS) profile domain-containing protein n=1 Tax=Cryptococcus wingfieldii CBS 7118 TaxID=1295528 RepID=A0A1E3JB25_9TREE|nr:hypothetical protein L198_03879 [Cryptococcus wingfieldii CBS 7118]ODN97316.1 hypothetical protein L198_03879 [Cryptococcus wingfieldii CBS 7118]